MKIGNIFIRAVGFLMFILVISLIIGQAVGHPVFISYATSGSMEPTIGTNDGYILIPTEVSGPIKPGDIVVFRAKEIHGGGLAVHRIIRETSRGYVTQGDANSFTDQSTGEPPVKNAQIVGTVPELGGSVFIIPQFGLAITETRSVTSDIQVQVARALGTSQFYGDNGLIYLFFIGTIVYYVGSTYRDWSTKDAKGDVNRYQRMGVRPEFVIRVCTAILLISATAAMIVPAGTEEFGVVSANFDSDRPDVIETGGSKERTHFVGNNGFLPVIAYIEPASDGVEVEPQEVRVEGRSVTNATVTLHAPPETGYYRRFIVEHRYLALLPQPVIHGLYQIHPWAPIVAIDALIGVPFYLIGITLVGTGPVRQRTSSRDTSTAVQLTRLVRSIYR